MTRNHKIFIILFIFPILSITFILLSCGGYKPESPFSVVSPDNKTLVTVTTEGGENGNQLMYDVVFNEIPVVYESPLGVMLKGIGTFSEDLNIISVNHTSTDEMYSIPFGKSTEISNKYNEIVLSLEDQAQRKIDIIFRVYNDGVAFRYQFPEQKNLKDIEITGELSAFHFLKNHTYWGQHVRNYTSSYENSYTISELANITPDSLTALPLLIKVSEDAWVALTEANLTDYAGMYVRGVEGADFNLAGSLSPLPQNPDICVKAQVPHASPWRVLMITDNPGRLIESNIILNLNEPCTFDTSWIKPGKTAWDWWCCQKVVGEDFEGTMDNRTMKYFIDFAAEYNLEYMLIDAGWYNMEWTEGDITKPIPDIDIPELVTYADNKGVDILIWLHWTLVDKQVDEAFPLYEKWGVKGVKIDFMNRDDQEMVHFYHETLKKAAEHKLVVDFHGAYKPTGIRRTYPNLLTREGLRGLEWVKVSDNVDPEYNCILPFTRMLAGPMDYTPGGFTNATRSQFKPPEEGWNSRTPPMTPGTRCHQLALFVIFESPLQMVPDYPANYRGKPESEFLRHVPSVWDETRVLHAKVGDYVTIARKNGEEWYLGSITDWTSRELSVPLDFLGSGDYVAEIYADGADANRNAGSVSIRKVLVGSDQAMNIKMAPGGGHTVRFYPAPEGTDLPRYNQ